MFVRALNVPEYALDGAPVHVTRRVHAQAYLLDSIAQIEVRESQVLQRPNDAPVV